MSGFLQRILQFFIGNKNEKEIKALMPVVTLINEEFAKLQSLPHDQLRAKTVEFRSRISAYLKETDDAIEAATREAKTEDDLLQREQLFKKVDELKQQRDKQLEEVLEQILPEAFAVVKETARRFSENAELRATATELDRKLAVQSRNIRIEQDEVIFSNQWEAAGVPVRWNMVHYDVQLIGGIVLHQGKISEMATGEGKTLVATLPAYLNGLAGLGVHIVTVNDYLAKRDSEWNAPLFQFLGLRVDCIDKYEPHSEGRKQAYRADITYGTNNEFGFDYLRDNMVRTAQEMVQPKHHYAMVDEVDSVLIDDARTPLIISGQVDTGDEKQFYELKPRISKLVDAQKKVVNQYIADARRLIKDGKTGEKEGEAGFALYSAFRALPKNSALIKYLSEPGVKQIMTSAENYYMQEQQKNMPQVDQHLYFIIDEKNKQVDLTEKGIELITGSGDDAGFFIIPDVGSVMAEIEKSAGAPEEKLQRKDSLMQEFSVKSERIHSVNQLLKAYALYDIDVDYVVMEGKVKIVDENTGRILEGRRYSDGLHQAIEAKENVKVEAASQTLATVTLQNYFRMYHKLSGMTGTAETEAGEFWEIYKLEVSSIPTNRPMTREDKEDLVYRSVREKFNAIIDEIVRLQAAGRPVLVGTTSVEVSELLSRVLTTKKIRHNVLNAKQHQREADIVAEAGQPGAVTIATNMAGRGTDIKINDQVKAAGGLAIIGTERHDSRRVDRQLRGRSGRQGDPGSSQFFVSLEDNLMRLFGSERIMKIMDRMGYDDGEVIQHSMITKSIERAQKKVEENNFGIRKRLLEYDDVMNRQREVIYKRRRHALFGDRQNVDISNGLYDLCVELIDQFAAHKDFAQFKMDVIRYFSVDTSIDETVLKQAKADDLAERLYQEVEDAYRRKSENLRLQALPVLTSIHRDRGETIKFVDVPFTDGIRVMMVRTELQDVISTEGKSLMGYFERAITLALIDEEWKHHLRNMDDLKNEVQMASLEQKDPLVIYKIEAFKLFTEMSNRVNREISSFLLKGSIPAQSPGQVQESREPRATARVKEGRGNVDPIASPSGQAAPQEVKPKAEPVRVGDKVGRNDPCPCGSGKKYKKCHGQDAED